MCLVRRQHPVGSSQEGGDGSWQVVCVAQDRQERRQVCSDLFDGRRGPAFQAHPSEPAAIAGARGGARRGIADPAAGDLDLPCDRFGQDDRVTVACRGGEDENGLGGTPVPETALEDDAGIEEQPKRLAVDHSGSASDAGAASAFANSSTKSEPYSSSMTCERAADSSSTMRSADSPAAARVRWAWADSSARYWSCGTSTTVPPTTSHATDPPGSIPSSLRTALGRAKRPFSSMAANPPPSTARPSRFTLATPWDKPTGSLPPGSPASPVDDLVERPAAAPKRAGGAVGGRVADRDGADGIECVGDAERGAQGGGVADAEEEGAEGFVDGGEEREHRGEGG